MPDGKPVIGAVPGLPNLFLATGHEGGGLSMVILAHFDSADYRKLVRKIFPRFWLVTTFCMSCRAEVEWMMANNLCTECVLVVTYTYRTSKDQRILLVLNYLWDSFCRFKIFFLASKSHRLCICLIITGSVTCISFNRRIIHHFGPISGSWNCWNACRYGARQCWED